MRPAARRLGTSATIFRLVSSDAMVKSPSYVKKKSGSVSRAPDDGVPRDGIGTAGEDALQAIGRRGPVVGVRLLLAVRIERVDREDLGRLDDRRDHDAP